jgi:hypothetical protein
MKKYYKYLKKNMSGGALTYFDIVRYTNLINDDLGPNWCYTGSIAIYLYCVVCNIPNSYIPNDIDIIYVPDNCLDKPLIIAGFSRDPSVNTNDGLPYYNKNRNKMLDLICNEEMSYCEVNIHGHIFKLLSPDKLFDAYSDRYEDLNKSDDIIKDKINLLHKILSCINPINIKKYKKPTKTTKVNYESSVARSLFGDNDDNDDNEILMRQPSFGNDYE